MADAWKELVDIQNQCLGLVRRSDYRRLVAHYSIVPPCDDKSGTDTMLRHSIASCLIIRACLARYRHLVLSHVKPSMDGTWTWGGEFCEVDGERIGIVRLPSPKLLFDCQLIGIEFHDDYSVGEYIVMLPLAIALLEGT